MKKILLFLALISLIFLNGCGTTRQRIYCFGTTYEHENYSVRVDIDKENERFIYNFIPKNNKVKICYYFVIWCNARHIENDSEEGSNFQYTYENGEPIVFNDEGKIFLTESIVLYTYYNNASTEIKEAINTGAFNIEFGEAGSFILDNNV